jgi:acyl-CoA thioester hydrolase
MKGYRFRHRLKVRFSEVDAARIVFHSHYLNYFDVAATEYFAEGLKIKRHEQTMKGTFSYILKKSMLEYHSPARIDDRLDIWCRISRMGKTSLTMRFIITRDKESEPLVEGENVFVSYNFVNQSVEPIPEFIRQAIGEFEGEAE